MVQERGVGTGAQIKGADSQGADNQAAQRLEQWIDTEEEEEDRFAYIQAPISIKPHPELRMQIQTGYKVSVRALPSL